MVSGLADRIPLSPPPIHRGYSRRPVPAAPLLLLPGPLANTAMAALTQADFRRFLTLIRREPVVVDFGQLAV